MCGQSSLAWVRRKAGRLLDCGVLPFVPRRKKLAFLYWFNIIRGECEIELRYLNRLVKATDVAIDVGANIGLYTYRMSHLFRHVYAFEINDELSQYIDAFNPGNVTLIKTGLSSEFRQTTLYIPLVNRVRLDGWASLSSSNCSDATDLIEKSVEVRPLDSFGIESVSFMKIDVERHELEVLEGARHTIEQSRPTILVETVGNNRAKVIEFFRGLNYIQVTLRDLIDADNSISNCLFVPK